VKKKVIVGISVIVGIVILAIGYNQYTAYQKREKERISWLAPHYNEKKDTILLSDKVDKLNDKQENAFYSIARGAISSEDPSIEFTNLDDYSLFVKKAVGKHTYYLEYVCENPTIKMRFDTTVTVKLDKESLKGDTPFTYTELDSDLIDINDSLDDY